METQVVAVCADFTFRVECRYFRARVGTTNLGVNGYIAYNEAFFAARRDEPVFYSQNFRS